MFKKTLLATAATAALLGPVAAFAAGDMGQGTITFTGSVTEAPCSISAADSNLAIDLGQISKKVLSGTGKFGTPVPVEIHLAGCNFEEDTTTKALKLSKVNITFPGQTSTTGMIPNTGDATGVAIQMMNADNTTAVNFGTGSAGTQMHQGNGNMLSLFARIANTGATAATAGSVAAKVTYMLDYK
ncbi:fimbrial protein [Achromobacter xylosoxidans]|uniref:fimbrial protein n=1 Tax=Alcaligenes xylosoxydans xylosoxydans TaxID=85698 RepID=UPI001F1466AA|nr:fimbrial protein [Achromobacter xylosoxidans]MDZ5617881.1 fimbrial protein [Achromobacter xylosoxidans]MDZ5626898.1 fimbrial protein [Achromobacter xylosoxidans]MDZ5687295.1 fimbrial protein [Achromobacter xylosoxidans]